MASRPMTYRGVLLESLREIRFDKNELAYLALGSKPELHLRDRLAYRLYRRGFITAREWHRTDLAILRNNMAEAVLQSKAAYTWDMLRPHLGPYSAEIRGDVLKARKAAPEAQIFVLVFLTHLFDPVNLLSEVIKYARSLAKAVDKSIARSKLKAFLAPLGPTACWEFKNGEAFGVRVAVEAWLCGPVAHG